MSITDELREWVRHIGDNQHLGILTDFGKQALTNLADRIDAEHRAALEKVAAMVDEPDAGWSGCRSCKAHKRGGVVECQVHGNMLRCDRLEKRVSAIERKLNHKGER